MRSKRKRRRSIDTEQSELQHLCFLTAVDVGNSFQPGGGDQSYFLSVGAEKSAGISSAVVSIQNDGPHGFDQLFPVRNLVSNLLLDAK
jgi:hypothetical protein